MAAAFVDSGRDSPILDSRGKTHRHIEHQAKGYRKDDRTVKHEKALPLVVFRHRLRMAALPREQARAWLVGGALFFALRSCKYLFVGIEERKTRPTRACDVVFRDGHRVIPHDNPTLHLADTVSIDFGDQKSNIRDEIVTQENNHRDDLNSVILSAKTISRLRSCPQYSDKRELFTFFDGKSFSKIRSSEVLIDLRCSIDAIGKDKLGFTSNDVGTYSVQASLAMMMYPA